MSEFSWLSNQISLLLQFSYLIHKLRKTIFGDSACVHLLVKAVQRDNRNWKTLFAPNFRNRIAYTYGQTVLVFCIFARQVLYFALVYFGIKCEKKTNSKPNSITNGKGCMRKCEKLFIFSLTSSSLRSIHLQIHWGVK